MYTEFQQRRALVDGGYAFVGGGQKVAVAANYSFIQLFNPVASGVVLLLEAVAFSTAPGDLVHLCTHNAALGAAIAIGGAGPKLLGGAASVGVINSHNAAAQAGTIVGSLHTVASDSPGQQAFETPFKIPAGFGVHLLTNSFNINLNAVFQWTQV